MSPDHIAPKMLDLGQKIARMQQTQQKSGFRYINFEMSMYDRRTFKGRGPPV
jgi:hypothetical protein